MGDLLRAISDAFGTPNQPSSELDDQRSRILDAAAQTVATVGWKRITMGDVAKQARVGRATLYRCFSSKEDLRDALVTRELHTFIKGSAAVRASADNPDNAMVASLAFALGYLRDSAMLNRLRETEPETLWQALTDPRVLDTGREVSAQVWKARIYPNTDITEGQWQRLRTATEIMTRLVLSLAMTPTTIVAFGEPEQAEEFARQYMLPLLMEPKD